MSVLAGLVLLTLTVYAAIGVVFALWFVTAGVHRIDPEAAGATAGFRLLILPGTIALWPLLLARSATGGRAREEAEDP